MRRVDIFKYSLYCALGGSYPTDSKIALLTDKILCCERPEKFEKLIKKNITDDTLISSYIYHDMQMPFPRKDSIAYFLLEDLKYKINSIYLYVMYAEYFNVLSQNKVLAQVLNTLEKYDFSIVSYYSFLSFVYEVVEDFNRPKSERSSKRTDEVFQSLIDAFLEIKKEYFINKNTYPFFITDDIDDFCDKFKMTLSQFLASSFIDIADNNQQKALAMSSLLNLRIYPIEGTII